MTGFGPRFVGEHDVVSGSRQVHSTASDFARSTSLLDDVEMKSQLGVGGRDDVVELGRGPSATSSIDSSMTTVATCEALHVRGLGISTELHRFRTGSCAGSRWSWPWRRDDRGSGSTLRAVPQSSHELEQRTTEQAGDLVAQRVLAEHPSDHALDDVARDGADAGVELAQRRFDVAVAELDASVRVEALKS